MTDNHQFVSKNNIYDSTTLDFMTGDPGGPVSLYDAAHIYNQKQGYRIGNLCLLSDIDTTSELTSVPPLCEIPNTVSWFLGFTNLHGNLIPVFDLAPLLELSHSIDSKQMLLVFDKGENAAGVIIDGYPVTYTLPKEDRLSIKKAPPALKKYCEGGYVINVNVWLDFDCLKFLNDHSVLISNS